MCAWPGAALALVLGVAAETRSGPMHWTSVDGAGNACDPQRGGCFGAVAYDYAISTFEITNAQYAEFLDAVAAHDPFGLYREEMAGHPGGIARTGEAGRYRYRPLAGREDLPVSHVSFFDALRMANWLHNGGGAGDTETGAYTLSAGASVVRNPGARFFLPSDDEWYKAAYYDPRSASFRDFPAGLDDEPFCAVFPDAAANAANCGGDPQRDLRPVGSYRGAPSPFGTFDQGGNVYEWTEALQDGYRARRGGNYAKNVEALAAWAWIFSDPTQEMGGVGFRLAHAPEPGTTLLLALGLLGLARSRRPRRGGAAA